MASERNFSPAHTQCGKNCAMVPSSCGKVHCRRNDSVIADVFRGTRPGDKPENLHGGGRWTPLTKAQASEASIVVDRLLEALYILAVHKLEWARLNRLGLCATTAGLHFTQAAILVNRIGFRTRLLKGASEPTGSQHDRADGVYGPSYMRPPPTKTEKEALERLAVAITLLADIATNPVAIRTLRQECIGAVRTEAALALEQLQGATG